MGKVCHVRTCQMTCSAVGQIFSPIREWLTHVVFLVVIPKNSTSKCKMPNRSTKWCFLNTHSYFQQPTTSRASWHHFPLVGSLEIGVSERSVFQPNPTSRAASCENYASVKTYPVFFSTCCGNTKNKHQDLGNSRFSTFNFHLFYRFLFIITLIWLITFSKKNPIITGKCWV